MNNVLFDCVYPCPCGYFGDSLNPCPCENFGHPLKPCTCAPSAVTKYQKRISGPLLDRIAIHIEVPHVDYEKPSSDRLGGSSSVIRQRVEAARELQRARLRTWQAVRIYNPHIWRRHCSIDQKY